MEIDRREALRYLGYGRQEADRETGALLEECIGELLREADCRHVVREFLLFEASDGRLDCGCFYTESRGLRTNLSGCERVLIMAATLGSGADRLIFRWEKRSMAKAVVLQAAAAAMIEAYCNELCAGWKREYEERGLYLRPRFSPGYGDFPLTVQQRLLDGIDAGKRIGITLTDGGLMLPSKSVTAVIGAGKQPVSCGAAGCEACGKVDCAYRR